MVNFIKFEVAMKSIINFIQDNHSKSVKSVLRGLHYQLPPKSQGELVSFIQGEVFDVAVDLRQSSPHSINGWMRSYQVIIKKNSEFLKFLRMVL